MTTSTVIIRSVVNEIDPIGLIRMGCPDDEYDAEVREIEKLLQKIPTDKSLGKAIYEIFVEYFDKETAGELATYDKIAEALRNTVINQTGSKERY